jgi:hypothetical protein
MNDIVHVYNHFNGSFIARNCPSLYLDSDNFSLFPSEREREKNAHTQTNKQTNKHSGKTYD